MPRLELTHIILHHTGAEEKDTNQIRRYHMSKGWRDIGYDYVIEKSGKTVLGRSLTIQGAHAGVTYYNQHAIGIGIIGHLSNREIYPEQYSSLLDLIIELMVKWQIPSNNILLHRDIKNTECPGKLFPQQKLMSDIESRITALPPAGELELKQKIQSLLTILDEEKEKKQILQDRISRMEKTLEQIKSLVNNT